MSGECDDGFQLVSKRKAARRSHKKAPHTISNMPCDSSNKSIVDKEDVVSRIESCRTDILQSDLWKNFKGTVEKTGLEPLAPILNGHISGLEDEFGAKCQLQHNQGSRNSDALPLNPPHSSLDPAQHLACQSCETTNADNAGNGPVNSFRADPTDPQFPEGCHGYNGVEPVTNGDVSSGSSCEDCGSADGGHIVDLVCYGLGRFATCHIARYQLAFLLAIRDHFKLCGQHCHIFDPVFSEGELEILADLGCSIITINEEGKRRVSDRTLFFMPHCGTPLYNNLLWANWSMQHLPCVYILGNSFGTIETRTPRRVLKSEAYYMDKIFPHVMEQPLRNTFRHADVFNDLSLHSFNERTLSVSREPMDFWENNGEPVYPNNVEIIQNKANKK